MSGPCHRRRRETVSSNRLWCARYIWVEPFLRAGRRQARLEAGSIYQRVLRIPALGCKLGEDAVAYIEAGFSE